MTAEQRVRASLAFKHAGRWNGQKTNYVQLRAATWALDAFVYGTTPEEAWNKALIFLITERLKS